VQFINIMLLADVSLITYSVNKLVSYTIVIAYSILLYIYYDRFCPLGLFRKRDY